MTAQIQCHCCGSWVNFEDIEYNERTKSSMCRDCINSGEQHQQALFNPRGIFGTRNQRNKGVN